MILRPMQTAGMPRPSASFFICPELFEESISRMMLRPEEELMTLTKSDAFA